MCSFLIYPPPLNVNKKKRRKGKGRNHIAPMSSYTLSNLFSCYFHKIRKLCPFLHYRVINLSSLSGSTVKPSNKMNYSCRQRSGVGMSICAHLHRAFAEDFCTERFKERKDFNFEMGNVLFFLLHIGNFNTKKR